MWKTTDFPRATKGYTYSIVLQVLLSKHVSSFRFLLSDIHWNLLTFQLLTVLVTATTQILLWRDRKRASRLREAATSASLADEALPDEDAIEKRTVNNVGKVES